MPILRCLTIAGLVLAASPALSQTYYRGSEPRGYVETLIPSERHREPIYDVRTMPPAYAPPRTRAYTPVLFDDDDEPPRRRLNRREDRMYYDPYLRRALPRDATPAQRRQMAAPPSGVRRSIPDQYRKQSVAYDGPEKPGDILIDTQKRFLYLVQNGGTALRYGIGVGRDGFQWKGTHKVTNKREWPDWYPPESMRQRRPDLPKMMKGGPNNPLGARALYLGSTLYRIHGSNEPWTIGQAVSSGCFRMTNEDVEDLYERVPMGATVKVI